MKVNKSNNLLSKWLLVVVLAFGLVGVEPTFQNEYTARVKTECTVRAKAESNVSAQSKRKTVHFAKFTNDVNHKEKISFVFIEFDLAAQVKLVLNNHSSPFLSQKLFPFLAVRHSFDEDALILLS